MLTAYIFRESSDVCACAGADIRAAPKMTIPNHVAERIDSLSAFYATACLNRISMILMMLGSGTTGLSPTIEAERVDNDVHEENLHEI